MNDYAMYHYPMNNLDCFSNLLAVMPSKHTMGSSLNRYIGLKVHNLVDESAYDQVIVRSYFDRSCGISTREKNDKLFNYIRPTATIDNSTLYINCFPGIDYVFHYGNILKTYLALCHNKSNVIHWLPTEEECWKAIKESELRFIPKAHTVIMGYVEGLQWLSDDAIWHGLGNFLWKHVHLATGEGILLGCKHTYWGEIAGRIVSYLAMNGVKRIIYSGKLGTLNPSLEPNLSIATGNSSILPNGNIISWDNVFEDIDHKQVNKGIHITVPSVLQETTEWLSANQKSVDFVDPEIGHMALAAYNCNIQFSYFHIISDNLSNKYKSDLSNEREMDVINRRKELFRIIGTAIKNL